MKQEINNREKILITGAEGFLGSRLADYYRSGFQVIKAGHGTLDITDESRVMEFAESIGTCVVLHCAAISDTGVCEKDPELSHEINVLGTLNLAKACKRTNSRLVFMSSDQIYTGSSSLSPNRESDVSSPINVYGRDKKKAEQEVLALLPDAVCLRLTWMYDLPVRGRKTNHNLLCSLIRALVYNQQMTFPVHELRGITDVNEVIRLMEQAWKLPGGIYNYGSANDVNTYDTAGILLNLLVKNREEILQKDELRFVSEPRNLAMDLGKAKEHGIYFPTTIDGFSGCLKQYF